MQTTTEQPTTFQQIFHTEMRSIAPAQTAQFLADVFGWHVTDTPHPSYKMFDTPDDFEGHIGPVPEQDAGPSATNYLLVADIAAAETAVVEGGGTILVPRQEASGRGLYTWIEIPGGISMVLWQHLGQE